MRRQVRTALALLGMMLTSRGLAGQTPGDDLLDHLVGRWVLHGTIAGRSVTHDVSAAWVLGHEYVELREVSRERATNGMPAYDAIIYVMRDTTTKQYAVLWLDNTAAAPFEPHGIGPATLAGDSIPFVFRISDSESIRTTFVFDSRHDTWRWNIDNERHGIVQSFARVTLNRP